MGSTPSGGMTKGAVMTYPYRVYKYEKDFVVKSFLGPIRCRTQDQSIAEAMRDMLNEIQNLKTRLASAEEKIRSLRSSAD